MRIQTEKSVLQLWKQRKLKKKERETYIGVFVENGAPFKAFETLHLEKDHTR